MAKARMTAGFLASCLLLGSWVAPGIAAAPAAADILRFRPRQEGIVYSTPSPQEQAACTVELVKGTKAGTSGWLVRDAKGQTLRRFFDSNGDKKIDIYSYYLDGIEVYREIDSNYDEKIDQYRWLNAGGMKWGIDINQDGKIDSWKIISAEEVSQEILQAVITKDFQRLQALWLTDAELKSLELPTGETARIQELQKQAYTKFQNTLTKLGGLNDKAHWVRLEVNIPQCQLSETLGSKQDIVKHAQASVLYELNGKHEWLQTGELIQVGLAWRIVDAPAQGDGHETASSTSSVTPEVQALLDELKDLDKNPPRMDAAPGPNAEVVRYNTKRADILERIVAKVKPEEQEQWIRQVADCLSAAAQNSPEADKAAANRLAQLVERIVKASPGSGLAAYVTFREMAADYAVKLANPKDIGKVQEQWLERLAKFVETYPKAEDTADALLQLGMVSEFIGKENEAKKWYEHLAKNFVEHPLASKAGGALRRLELEGKVLELAGPTLQGSPFNVTQFRGKVVIVYYWASWNQQCVGDFAKLKLLLNTHGSKGVELVCVNLDNTSDEANSFLQRAPAPGIHLFQAGGLESPLASQYGIMVLPNLFLADKDGKCVSRTVQINNLEDEIKKLIK